MPLDAYAPCPCGSGKKVKFCCQAILGDMEKILRIKDQQPQRALRLVQELAETHPTNSWLCVIETSLLTDDRQFEAARSCAAGFLERNPGDPHGLALYALTSLGCDGFETAKRSIHRAFQKSARTCGTILSRIAGGIANVMHVNGFVMAAREHQVLAVRYADAQFRDQEIRRLAAMDSNPSTPYPLRSVHTLVQYNGPADRSAEAERASRLSQLGCWEPAAILFGRLRDVEPENPVLWHNLGLCQAWDGNHADAAVSLHKASELYDDPDTAIECETMAQIIDVDLSDDVVEIREFVFNITSVSQLVTRLDGHPLLQRQPNGKELEESGAVAGFMILDREIPEEFGPEDWTIDNMVCAPVELAIFDAAPDDDPPQVAQATLSGIGGDAFDAAVDVFVAAARELAVPEGTSEAIDAMPRVIERMHKPWFVPINVPQVITRRLAIAQYARSVDRHWLNAPNAALDGQTPLSAAGKPEFRVKLAAAAYVLDAFSEQTESSLDFTSVCEKLELPAPGEISVDEKTLLAPLSIMELLRLPLEKLSDNALLEVAERAWLIRHFQYLRRVTDEIARRPQCIERFGAERLYLMQFSIARREADAEAARRFVTLLREVVLAQNPKFEGRVTWELRELELRLKDPADPEIPIIVRRIESQYIPKIDRLRLVLWSLLGQHNQSHLMSDSRTSGVIADTGEIWTPESAAEPAAAGQTKLWVPGED